MLKRTASIEKIATDISQFLSKFIGVEYLILFGSYASGNYRNDSDIDIAVISDDFEQMSILEKIDLLAKVPVNVDSRIELLGYSSKDFTHPARPSLLDNIKKTGKILFRKV